MTSAFRLSERTVRPSLEQETAFVERISLLDGNYFLFCYSLLPHSVTGPAERRSWWVLRHPVLSVLCRVRNEAFIWLKFTSILYQFCRLCKFLLQCSEILTGVWNSYFVSWLFSKLSYRKVVAWLIKTGRGGGWLINLPVVLERSTPWFSLTRGGRCWDETVVLCDQEDELQAHISGCSWRKFTLHKSSLFFQITWWTEMLCRILCWRSIQTQVQRTAPKAVSAGCLTSPVTLFRNLHWNNRLKLRALRPTQVCVYVTFVMTSLDLCLESGVWSTSHVFSLGAKLRVNW